MKTLIFGHKNPDTDSIASALGLSYLKNKLGEDTVPCALGMPSKETEFALKFFETNRPKIIENVKTQINDVCYDKPPVIYPKTSILEAFKIMEEHNLKALPIVGDKGILLGAVTMKDIAMSMIKGDFYFLETSLRNIIQDLDGILLKENEEEGLCGKIAVMAFQSGMIKGSDIVDENSVIIVGNRHRIIEHAIEKKVKLIIVTGESIVPECYYEYAAKNKVNIIATKNDTYTVSKLIHQTNFVSSIMTDTDKLVKFYDNEYLEDVADEMKSKMHSNYPILDEKNKFLGFIARKHILNPGRKKVIIVDHNEYSQSAEGLNEANILEVIDHHKIGDISTSKPINFRNMTVGSTCTIVYRLYNENNIKIPYDIAGILISGIISDTLFLKSPTTTEMDSIAIAELNQILKLDLKSYSMQMFRAGTSLEGQSINEIFYKDFKEFVLEDEKVGISQIFTLDIEDIINRKESFIENIANVFEEKEHYLTLMIVTDIMKNGSYLLYKSQNNNIIANAFDNSGEQGVFAATVVSRKQQVVPKIMQEIKNLK